MTQEEKKLRIGEFRKNVSEKINAALPDDEEFLIESLERAHKRISFLLDQHLGARKQFEVLGEKAR